MGKKHIQNISIFGSGLMGSGIAQLFAAKETFHVTILALEGLESQAGELIRSNLMLLHQNGIGTLEEIEKTLANLTITVDRGAAARQADFIIECIPEDMALKQDLFQELDRLCGPDVILATNTSVMSITEIASKGKNRGRMVGTHFWNPPYLIPLVEVVKGDDTTEETMERTMELLHQVGKHPIRVNRDVPGFVANRLQHALWREAFSLVERGIADAATVDEALKYGPGLRLPILAPLENADMVGLDLTLAIHDYLLKHLEDSHEPSSLLTEKVAKGELGFKTGSGFRTWTPDEAAASKKRLNEYLIRTALKATEKA